MASIACDLRRYRMSGRCHHWARSRSSSSFPLSVRRSPRPVPSPRPSSRALAPAVVLPLRRQPGAAATVRARFQPRELPVSAWAPKGGEALVAHDAAREADQDRRKGGAARPLRHVLAGGSHGATLALRVHPGAGPAVRGGGSQGWTGMRARSVRQRDQRRAVWDVGASGGCDGMMQRLPRRSADDHPGEYRRRLSPHAARSGFHFKRKAVC